MDLVVVDGPNLFNVVAVSVARNGDPEFLKQYLAEWFDVDRLVLATVGASHFPMLGTISFHSRRALGRTPYRFNTDESDAFWGRQGGNPNSSCFLVDIPGEQTETYPFVCRNCQTSQEATTTSEKGVDTSITTYLLETASRWNSVCIVSKDVDFVPPVLSLRRLGKQVFCAVESSATTSALVRACQSSFPLSMPFLDSDFALMRFFIPGGALDAITAALAAESNVTFRARRIPAHHREFARDERQFEIGISHGVEEGAVERIKGLVGQHIQRIPGLEPLVEWEVRNAGLGLLFLHLRGPDLLFASFERHVTRTCKSAEWHRWEGSLFDVVSLT